MKKSIVSAALLAATGFATSANAALVNDGSMTLTIDQGTAACVIGGTFPNCDYGAATATGGSYFLMDGNLADVLGGNNGITLGVAQPFDGNAPASGVTYDGSGSNITNPWNFFGSIGTNFSVGTGISAIDDTSLDMSGWRVAWGEVPEINMGAGAPAAISCGTCNINDTYTLTYSAVVPAGDPSGFGGTAYDLVLTGTIIATPSAVPVPAAVWLFGSGLLGLAGVARRRKAA